MNPSAMILTAYTHSTEHPILDVHALLHHYNALHRDLQYSAPLILHCTSGLHSRTSRSGAQFAIEPQIKEYSWHMSLS